MVAMVSYAVEGARMPSRRLTVLGIAAVLGIGQASPIAQGSRADSLQGPLTLTGSFGNTKPGPIEQRAKPVTADNPIPRRTVFVAPSYPDAAAVVETRLVVPLRVTVDESGYVAEVRHLGAPMLAAWRHPLLKDDSMASVFEALVAASTDAIRQWRYDAPNEGPITFDVTIGFAPETEPRVVVQPLMTVAPPPSFSFVPDIAPGERIDAPPVDWAEGVPPLSAFMAKILVPPSKTKHVAPVYPQEAKDANVQGTIVIQARVEADGRISHARVLRSIPQLDQAALDAVMQWEFEPLVIDGQGVTYLLTTTLVFTSN
jgi:TonB family protein